MRGADSLRDACLLPALVSGAQGATDSGLPRMGPRSRRRDASTFRRHQGGHRQDEATMTYATMGDAAFAANLDGTSFDIVAGYYGGPNAFHRWPVADWDRFPGYRLPIWVGGQNGLGEGSQAVASLEALRVPHGSVTVLDMEGRKDITYVNSFGHTVREGGYKVWVYGSASTIGLNPPLNGYWVADYGINPRAGL